MQITAVGYGYAHIIYFPLKIINHNFPANSIENFIQASIGIYLEMRLSHLRTTLAKETRKQHTSAISLAK